MTRFKESVRLVIVAVIAAVVGTVVVARAQYQNTDSLQSNASAPSSVAWATVFDCDFTVQPAQAMATNGTYTICNQTWTKINSANDSAAMAVNADGGGLTVTPVSATDYFQGTRTAPAITVPLSSLSASFSWETRVRVYAFINVNNGGAANDAAVIAIDNNQSGAGAMKYVHILQTCNKAQCQGGYTDLWAFHLYGFSTQDSANYRTVIDGGVVENVAMVSGGGYEPNGYTLNNFYTGNYSGGWPTTSTLFPASMLVVGGSAFDISANFNTDPPKLNQNVLLLGAKRGNSATSNYNVLFGRVRVDMLNIGSSN